MLFIFSYIIYIQSNKMEKSRQVKKKLVQNFQFDANDIKNQNGCKYQDKISDQIINAKNILLNEFFTLKRINLNDQQTKYLQQNMLREISILKDLNGANIIKCHKILKSKSHIYLVYDYSSNKSLDDIIKKNEQIITRSKKIDISSQLKLQQDTIQMQTSKLFFQLSVEIIGKQLCQVLKQIQSHKIVHMNFYPSNIIIFKHNLLKLSNFSIAQIVSSSSSYQGNMNIDSNFQKNQYSDPYLLQTGNYGYYTDIYSFGKLLQKMYQIYKRTQNFKPQKRLQQLISKMVLKNPYERLNLKYIYEYFFTTKKEVQTKKQERKGGVQDAQITKSRDYSSNKVSRKQIPINKQDVSAQRPLKQSPKADLQLNLRKSHNQYQTRPPMNSKSPRVQAKNLTNNVKSLVYSRNRQKQSLSPTHSGQDNTPGTPQSMKDVFDNFKKIAKLVLKKRNISVLLIQLADIVSNKIQGHCNFSLPLVFLLYKKSLIEIVALAKYLNKGSKKYMPEVSQANRLKFVKTEDYFMLSKIINDQLEQQRNMLVSISSLIKKQCPMLLQRSNPQSIQPVKNAQLLKSRQIFIPQPSDFEKQINYQAFNNDFFMNTIYKFLETFSSDLLILNKKNPYLKEILYYLNILLEIVACQSYQNFVNKYFTEYSFTKSENNIDKKNINKVSNFSYLLRLSPELNKLESMSVDELQNQLIAGLKLFE